VRAPTMAGV